MKSRISASERPTSLNRTTESRPARTSINGLRNLLTVKGMEPGFHYCWVNEDKVDRYLEAAYDFVTHDVQVGDRKINAASMIGGKVSKSVGSIEGKPMLGYLMRIEESLHQEDMREHHDNVDAMEASFRADIGDKPNNSGQYGEVRIGNK